MKLGTLYGIGIGPGDPELITLKGSKILSQCMTVIVPKTGMASQSVALTIARQHVHPEAQVLEVIFPMIRDRTELQRYWENSALEVRTVLEKGEDACFLTLGDALLYSTYIYLVRALRKMLPELKIVTVPGITAFSAAAALTEFTIGEAKQIVTIVPTADDLGSVRRALQTGDTVILMKIGNRLESILDLMEEVGVIDSSVLVSRAGLDEQQVVTDLKSLRGEDPKIGYLSIILIHANGGNSW